MRKSLAALVAVLLATSMATLALAGTASAQDVVQGTVTADPATVPAPGEYTFTATGTDFIPDSSVLVVKCVAPGDALVPGEADLEAIVAKGAEIDPLADCDIGSAQNVDVDSSGGWTAELTAEVGDNFFLSAGALDGSQAGGTWIAIVPEGAGEEAEAETTDEEDLPETGVETPLLGIIGVAVLGAGVMIAREGRRLR